LTEEDCNVFQQITAYTLEFKISLTSAKQRKFSVNKGGMVLSIHRFMTMSFFSNRYNIVSDRKFTRTDIIYPTTSRVNAYYLLNISLLPLLPTLYQTTPGLFEVLLFNLNFEN